MKNTTLFLIMLLILFSSKTYAASDFYVDINDKNTKVYEVNVIIDGKKLECDFKPYSQNSKTFVPIREIVESLGAKVTWNDKLKNVTIDHKDKKIMLKIDSNIVYINGEKKKIDDASIPRLTSYKEPKNETKTMVPLRFLTETLGYEVSWDNDSQTAGVYSDKGKMKELKSSENLNVQKTEEPKKTELKVASITTSTNSTEDNKNAIIDNNNEITKKSEPIKTSALSNGTFVSNIEKKEMNEIKSKSEKEQYKAAGLSIDFEEKEERVINKKIKPIGKVSILIDPGHGGTDSGALVESGLQEKTLNLKVAKMLESKLSSSPYEVAMTRDEDEYVKLLDRANIANNQDFELFISIHFNSTENREAKGIEVLYANERNVEIKETEQKHFASALLKSLIAETGAVSRGIKNRPDLVVLNKTKCVSAIVELGFMSNPDDYEYIIDDEYLEKLAEGIYKGINNYVNEYVEM
ncbi:N-acetylmuramoyl-L-alanine amidase [Peptoniphilus sp. ING2-D1G]|nr:N-acetylmuramoyl-L-alanine amidase [Peptoniphilus sp. ING2-D1G]